MIAALLLTALGAGPADLAAESGWRPLGQRSSRLGPIAVRGRTIDDTPCFEGALTTDVPVHALVETADRMRDAASWSRARLPVTKELERAGRRFVLVQVLDVPAWTLAADRAWVLRGETTLNADGSGTYRYQREPIAAWPAAAALVPQGAVELPVSFGEWTFRPADGGTRVTWRSCADFGGSVPTSVQSWVALQQLPDTMEDLVGAAVRRAAP